MNKQPFKKGEKIKRELPVVKKALCFK